MPQVEARAVAPVAGNPSLTPTAPPMPPRVVDLPALPALVQRLVACLGRDDVSASQIAEQLAQDQALAAKALRLANSPFYGLSREVGSIAEATAILGLRALRGMVVAAGVMQSMPRPDRPGFDHEVFWRHALATALAARALAHTAGVDEELAFTAGLLHDIGRLAMVVVFPDEHAAIAARQALDDVSWPAAEQVAGGLRHAELGGRIADEWHFLPAIAEAVRWHHAPPTPKADHAAEGDAATLVDVVHVADAVAHALDLAGDPNERVPAVDPAAWGRLRLTPERCLAVFERTRCDVDAVCSVLIPHHVSHTAPAVAGAEEPRS